jgi:hypothetical protein
MRENTLKQRLYAGKAAFGVMCTLPSSVAYLQTMRQAAADAGK